MKAFFNKYKLSFSLDILLLIVVPFLVLFGFAEDIVFITDYLFGIIVDLFSHIPASGFSFVFFTIAYPQIYILFFILDGLIILSVPFTLQYIYFIWKEQKSIYKKVLSALYIILVVFLFPKPAGYSHNMGLITQTSTRKYSQMYCDCMGHSHSVVGLFPGVYDKQCNGVPYNCKKKDVEYEMRVNN